MLDVSHFTRRGLSPPTLKKREVMFYGVPTGGKFLAIKMMAYSDLWSAKHLPYKVPIPPDKFERQKIRVWLNKNIQGIWTFDLPDDQRSTAMSVRMSDQTEASAFRIFWC